MREQGPDEALRHDMLTRVAAVVRQKRLTQRTRLMQVLAGRVKRARVIALKRGSKVTDGHHVDPR